MNRPHDPYAAFRVRDYRNYLGGWLVAMVGTRIQGVAIGWEMYQRTGDALALGIVGLVQAAPIILLALPAGYLADRMDRRRLLMFSMFFMTLTSLGLAALSYIRGPIPLMYALLFLDSTALTLGRPARMALLPVLVPREVFPNAVTWNTSTWQISSMAGPAIGGFIVSAYVPAAYLVCASGSLAFLLLLSRMRLRHDPEPPARTSRAEVLAGVRFVWRTRVILAAVALDMFAVLFGGAVYLLPIFATDILRVGAQGYGWLNAAPAAGAFCMALTLAHLPPMRRAGRNLLLAVTGFGIATIVFGLSRSFWLSLAMLFLTGALDNVSVVIRHTLIQLMTPDRMRGRVAAVNTIFISASNELGGMESGVVAHFFGPLVSAVSGGIGTLIVVLVTAVVSPTVRRVKSLQELHPAESGPSSPAPGISGVSR
ncbi:MAG: MFS transporter [Candidatus Eisenbacteria bacterium]